MADATRGAAYLDRFAEGRPSLVTPLELRSGVEALWHAGLPPGDRTGWPSVDKLYTVVPGQMTVVTGWPSSGKSEWLDAMLVNLARQGWKIAMFSPENQPLEVHATKLLEKLSGKPFGNGPTQRIAFDELPEYLDELSRSFAFLTSTTGDAVAAKSVIDSVTPWLKKHEGQKRGLVIDPWNELEHWRPSNLSETEYVSQTLSMLRGWARANAVHVWIVAHPQKMRRDQAGELPIPRPDMISGCHDAMTEVLTTRGWVGHAEVTRFDRVCCFDPESGLLVYHSPTAIHEYDHDGEMHHWVSPSYDAMVTPNHRMVVRPNWRRKPSFASRYSGSGLGRPQAYPLDAWSFVESREVKSDMEMPWAAPLMDSAESARFTDAEISFLGDWISEGWLNRNAGISVCQAVGEKADIMRATLVAMGVKFTERVDDPRGKGRLPVWRAYLWRSAFTEWVAANCGICAAVKRLPEETWALSRRQKEILFTSLMAGDGNWTRSGGTYTTISKQLADQVQRLSIELGRMASVRSRKAHGNNQECYVVVIGEDDRAHISIRPARNLERTAYRGKVYCLTVPTGAYVVRRNGKPGIYGNSQHWWNKADCAVTVWRDLDPEAVDANHVQIHVQKCRFKHVGKIGVALLAYDRVTGRYSDIATLRDVKAYRDRED